MNLAVEMEGVHKKFVYGWPRKKQKHALRGVDLAVPVSAFWGILGPNGAGKTTLLSILANLITAEQGFVKVLGEDIRVNAGAVRARINLSSGHANFPWSLTVQENLNYYAMLYGLSGKQRTRKVEELISMFDLRDYAKVPFDGLSTGTKQKLSLAKSLINDPELLLLDEPTVGLDPDVSKRVRESIRYIHEEKGTTILMTTHNMKEAEILCEKLVFIKDGIVKAFGMPQDLKDELHLGDRITIVYDVAVPSILFNGMEGVYSFEEGGGYYRIVVDDHRKRLPHILNICMLRGVRIKNLTIKEVDLEDVFITLAK